MGSLSTPADKEAGKVVSRSKRPCNGLLFKCRASRQNFSVSNSLWETSSRNVNTVAGQIIFLKECQHVPSFCLFEYIQQGLTNIRTKVTIKNYQQRLKSIKVVKFSRSSRPPACRTSSAPSCQSTCPRREAPWDQTPRNLSCRTCLRDLLRNLFRNLQ